MARTGCAGEKLEVYTKYSRALKEDKVVRFEDILSMQIPVWIVDSYCDLNLACQELLENLLEFAPNEVLKSLYQEFWLRKDIGIRYPSW